ncbi:MAG: hypothetical protein KZQ66_17290 [Candidatus Thiodiazotropha sp. (ex Lucinoma aequizonata)]|nr:hypothetical protein [Candidatus Thiodiazotropha sp. (ex Lucinoma aequizonata)]MCU7888229.1 hypothetical protein [Candidatus Thiodiazotropha sp. (ex Lucinoma aequizonata)]MCU7894517.1 hypothetical protein [Candidatus Thiodiazotropha sp. (ex Lucinoma aequizonata)]MCU7900430.1 hypothetical protein [Candidatus Thiodiazotropha sp. (ex Lucinoma aequizonata)]MCU7903520.1 hypothetical protein [Candidatus Thiodiazotropha sp. (ex Lucinoma aequizonata)]
MKALLITAVELCLLRRAPQDLPSSVFLLRLMVVLNLLLGILILVANQSGIVSAVLETLFELVLMFAVIYIAMSLMGKLPRFIQTATAILLSSLLPCLLMLLLIVWGYRSEPPEPGLLLLVPVIWIIVVLGHIIRHTFVLPFSIGIAATLLYYIITWILEALLFSVVV